MRTPNSTAESGLYGSPTFTDGRRTWCLAAGVGRVTKDNAQDRDGTTRALSALLQAVVVVEATGQPCVAGDAFLLEYGADFERAGRKGLNRSIAVYTALLEDLFSTAYALVGYAARETGHEPKAVLDHLIQGNREKSPNG